MKRIAALMATVLLTAPAMADAQRLMACIQVAADAKIIALYRDANRSRGEAEQKILDNISSPKSDPSQTDIRRRFLPKSLDMAFGSPGTPKDRIADDTKAQCLQLL